MPGPGPRPLARARWLEREAKLLLPVEYHHVVFTLPAELAELAIVNPVVMYDSLFRAASATLRDVAANPKRLGAQVGMLMVLHTWGQSLCHHPHVHAVVTGGGLSCDEQGRLDREPMWRSCPTCPTGFFLPVRILSRGFRGKYLALLKDAFERGTLVFAGRHAALAGVDAFSRWLRPLYGKEWVVYSKPPFGGPAQVLKYLARYTHRVAIDNRRILAVTEEAVTFRSKDYAKGGRSKTIRLSGEEFLRRFLTHVLPHVLPRGFVKIRHYGLLANRRREECLATCRRLLLTRLAGVEFPAFKPAVAIEQAPAPHCPRCGGNRLVRCASPEETPPGAASPADTS